MDNSTSCMLCLNKNVLRSGYWSKPPGKPPIELQPLMPFLSTYRRGYISIILSKVVLPSAGNQRDKTPSWDLNVSATFLDSHLPSFIAGACEERATLFLKLAFIFKCKFSVCAAPPADHFCNSWSCPNHRIGSS